nr:uncharacterized protein LOC127329231 [Lolium perenne]
MIKELLRIGSQFVGYREYAARAEEKLSEANERVDALAQKLEQSEAARKKAELAASEAKAEADEAKVKAASVEALQKSLTDAESALNEQKTAQAAREQDIIKRLKSQSRRTLSICRFGQELFKNEHEEAYLQHTTHRRLSTCAAKDDGAHPRTPLAVIADASSPPEATSQAPKKPC